MAKDFKLSTIINFLPILFFLHKFQKQTTPIDQLDYPRVQIYYPRAITVVPSSNLITVVPSSNP
jgi:hypothetical protein